MATQTVAAYTPVIKKGAVFRQTFIITDEDTGLPVTLNSAQIDVFPNGAAADFSWTQANGKFTNVSAGVYDLFLTAVETAALTWTSGRYRMNVVDQDGDENPCFIENLIFAEDC